MIQCPGCGSQMIFDIKSQQMKCKHCDTLMMVSDADKLVHYADEDTYEATVYKCSQCGAELMSQENEAVAFCSFCGTQAILPGEIKTFKRPKSIIPFKKTKEECKQIYKKRLNKALYAPSDMKKTDHVDSFKGIYMPYYIYDIEQAGYFHLTGQRSYRRGDYIYTEHHKLGGNIKGNYNVPHDASSNFADNISEAIAPFDLGQKQKFSEGFLHGFYADTGDMDEDEYRPFATDVANQYALSQVKNVPVFSGLSIDQHKNTSNLSDNFSTGFKKMDNAMFPVWFLSFKRAGRISYATINAQTGRIYADIPVSIFKFFIGTLLLLMPIYLLFDQVFESTFTPGFMTFMCSLLSIGSLFLVKSSVMSILQKERELVDGDRPKSGAGKKKLGSIISGQASGIGGGVLYVCFIIFYIMSDSILETAGELFRDKSLATLNLVALIVGIIVSVLGIRKQKEVYELDDITAFISPLVGLVVNTVIAFVNPAADFVWYIACIISFVGCCIALVLLIRAYNILCTRMPRTFNRRGGDDYGI